MLTIRCSSLPRLMAAPCSVLAPGARIEHDSEPAANGSAAHELLALHIVNHEAVTDERIVQAVARWGADATEVGILFAQGRKLWRAREADYPAPMTEVSMRATWGDLTLTGTADVVSVRDDGVAWAADHKTSRVDGSYYWQLAGYALLVMAEWPHVDTVRAEVWWVRDGEAEPFTFRRDDAPALIAQIAEAAEWTGTYTTGPTCRWCSLAHACEARQALVRADARALVELDADLATMPAADVIRLYEAAQRVTDAADRLRAAARERAANAPIEADGKVLALRPTNGAREVDVPKAWPVLDAHGLLDEDAVGEVLAVKLGAAEKVIKARAPKGKGAGAIREFNASLDAAGAIQRTTVQKLELRRAAPTSEEETK